MVRIEGLLKRVLGSSAAGAMLLAVLPAFADAVPEVRAARLTFTDGYVHVDRVANTVGDPAVLNMPLVEGQVIVTGENGQAEVEFEDGSVGRITPNSSLRLTHLSLDGGGNYVTQLGLLKGLAFFELRSVPHFRYTVEAAGDVVSPAENTTVRVNLDEPPAAIAVLDGTARVEREGGYKTDVHAGETFRSDISGVGRYFLTQEIAPDTWDQWNEARDQAAVDATPKQTTVRDGFAGNEGYGWSDLDANGSWYDVPGQGQVWQPTGGDDASFDPYGNGSWVYAPGGYTWASGYAWGWTPFRCGGWSYWNTFGWGWSPNAACGGGGFAGGYGYGGYGYGSGINIVLAPHNYPIRHRPGGGGPGVHPIIRVGGGTIVAGGLHQAGTGLQGPHRIGGVVATPVRPIGNSYTSRGGSAVGGSLRRDFPVDRTTHAPLMGTQSSHTTVQSGLVQSGSAAGTIRTPANASGSYGRPAPGTSVRPGVEQGMRPGFQPGTQPGYQPGVRPANPPTQGGYARPDLQSFPNSSQGQYRRPDLQAPRSPQPPPQAPHYAAPPPQMAHPSYSAPAPQMRSAPAPAASAPAHK